MVCYAIESPQPEGARAQRKATLVLEDGKEFQGYVFGSPTSVAGEVGKYLKIYVILIQSPFLSANR